MHKKLLAGLGIAGLLLVGGPVRADDTTPEAQLRKWSAAAGQPGQASKGKTFFTRTHGNTWSCASCHTELPTAQGRHANTGKTLKPLAPSANPAALTDTRRVDKWLRRNCKDVLNRECTSQEKADVLAFLIQPKH